MQITQQTSSDLIYHHVSVEITSLLTLTIIIREDNDERGWVGVFGKLVKHRNSVPPLCHMCFEG